MSDFFALNDVGLATDTNSLLQTMIAYLQDTYPGYTPQPANLEYIMGVVFATWAADLANLCTSGGSELFLQYGQKLFNLPMEQGTSATAVVQVSAVDDMGYTLPAGTQFLFDSTASFQTFQPYTIPYGSTTINVVVAANTPGTQANGLGNKTVVLNQQISWVLNTTLVTQSAGGLDPETSDQYVQRLAQTIQLAAPRPITASDFGTMSLNFTPATGTDQEEVGRAVAIDGLNLGYTYTQSSPGSYSYSYTPNVTFTGNITNGSATVTNVAPTTGISINSLIAGAYIPLGATVSAINGSSAATATASAGSNTLTLKASASGSVTGASLTSTGTYYNERTVCVCVTDTSGIALNPDTMSALGTWLQSLREVNFIVNVVPPSYNNVYATVSVYRNQLYDATTVQANVQQTLLTLLSPSGWGVAPDSSGTIWFNVPTIYQSVIESAIQNTTGVDHIQTGSLGFGLTPSPPTSGGDVTLVGAFPLPSSSATTIPLSAITVLN